MNSTRGLARCPPCSRSACPWTRLAAISRWARGWQYPAVLADPEDAPQVYHNFVGPRFFETMGIPVLAGRDFDLSDDERAPQAVVINDSVARRYFPDEDPLGRQIVVGPSPTSAVASIVGVVKDVRYASLRADAPLMVYRPYRQATGCTGGHLPDSNVVCHC